MRFTVSSGPLVGSVCIPGSKSHTIRALFVATLADGVSRVLAPLDSADARSAVEAATALGAHVRISGGVWEIRGTDGRPCFSRSVLDVGNSGTTLRLAMGAASLAEAGSLVLTGDDQVRRRPVGPLAGALADLGVGVRCLASQGCAPVEIVGGGFRGGTAAVDCPTSQYLSSLLLACPLARGDTEIRVTRLNEEPYVRMTLDWLDAQGIVYEARGLRWFRVPGGQRYRAFERRIPADFSSASFFLAAGALLGNRIVCEGLDLEDTQGDKAVIDYLSAMGAAVSTTDQGIEVSGRGLRGVELDLNETPDALPIMAALACFAEGRTVLRNVAHARLKETDRIAVMALELGKLGARIEELEDGLVIEGGPLRAAPLDGHGDHRVVMALAVAASAIPGACVIHSAEAVDVTFPTFPELFRALGGRLIPG